MTKDTANPRDEETTPNTEDGKGKVEPKKREIKAEERKSEEKKSA